MWAEGCISVWDSKQPTSWARSCVKSWHWSATAWRNKEIKSTAENEEVLKSEQLWNPMPLWGKATMLGPNRSHLWQDCRCKCFHREQLWLFPRKKNQERQVFRIQPAREEVWRYWDWSCVNHLNVAISQRSEQFAFPSIGHDHFCSEHSLCFVKSLFLPHGIQWSHLQTLLGSSWRNTYFWLRDAWRPNCSDFPCQQHSGRSHTLSVSPEWQLSSTQTKYERNSHA